MGGSKPESDALAETAAADASGPASPALDATATSAHSAPAPPVPGATPAAIGRYQIDGELGHGAMGVVYAAHDADLERRIALKVLRGSETEASRARLLREARAMARLSHPAVVTVHEVGTAGGVDYVAMELIDGTTLAEWIATAKPTHDELLAAFDTAGRGLAAAHAAGLIHRDFKPQNVLRSKRGRVVVTDFGLARSALDDPEPPSGSPARDRPADAGSLSSTLTATGAVLGTPAYMAPEQHDGVELGPAADQFAFCVAVWEALAGARPFTGQTLAAVRQQIDRGPDATSEAKIPRRLRPVLRRGLAVDPAARYPNMDALLAALGKRRARIWVGLGALGLVAVGFAIAIASSSPSETSTTAAPVVLEGCGPAEVELATITKAPGRAELAAQPATRAVLAKLDALAADWVEVQRRICPRVADPAHVRRVQCLRAVRADLETALSAFAALPAAERPLADPVMLASDPRSCEAKNPPNRVVVEHDGRELAIAVAGLGSPARRAALPDPGEAAPCLRAQWVMTKLQDFETLAHATSSTQIAVATEASDRCGDDRLAASLTMIALSSDFGRLIEDPGQTRRMSAAVERSGNDRMLAPIGIMVDALMASFRHDMDGAIERVTQGVDRATAIGARRIAVQCASFLASWLFQRSGPGDAAHAERRLREALAIAVPAQRTSLQYRLIELLYAQDRGAEAAPIVAALGEDEPPSGSMPISGRVLDESGRPVAGARVVAQNRIAIYRDAFDPTSAVISTAVSAADGTFAIRAAPPGSLVMAGLGTRRTAPALVAPTVELRMAPASGVVFGTVKRIGEGLGRISIQLSPSPPFGGVEYTTSIAGDGTWRIEHLPPGKAKLTIAYGDDPREVQFRDVVIGAKPVGPIHFEVARRGVPLHIVVRNQVAAPIALGATFVIRGRFSATVMKDLDKLTSKMIRSRAFPVRREEAPPPVRDTLGAGDVLTRIGVVEPGEVTVCALGITGDLGDPQHMRRVERHSAEMEIACKPLTITTADQVILIEVPPMKRLPED